VCYYSIVILYKDNDFIPSSIDIYSKIVIISKVNITMAPWLYTSGGIFRRNDYIGEVEEEFHRNDD
jgi:hypothetical protein